MIMPPNLASDFCVKIDFLKNTPNPERIFTTMSSLINSFQNYDDSLARSLNVEVQPVLMLEDIEVGSLKTWLSSALKKLPDNSIENLDWKQAIGHYLVKAKYIVINWLDGKTNISDRQQIIDVQYEVIEAAKETGVEKLGTYSPLRPKTLVKTIGEINSSVAKLHKGDSAEFISDVGSANFNLGLNLSPSNLEELITMETIESKSTMILKVKKPDYLGESMWEFYYGYVIDVKIKHFAWLEKFQQRKVDVRPGDSIRGIVNTIVKYGYDFSVVDTHYELIEVLEIIPAQSPR